MRAACLILVLCVSPAVAQMRSPADQQRAYTLFQQGSAATQAGRFAEAAELFRQARALDPRPSTVYAHAVVLERLQRLGEAREAISTYFSIAPLNDERRAAAMQLHTRLAQSASSDEWVDWLLLAGGSGVAAVGVVLAIIGHVGIANVQNAPLRADWSEYRGAWDTSWALAGVGWAIGIAGLALAGVGLTLALTRSSGSQVALLIGPDGAWVRGTF